MSKRKILIIIVSIIVLAAAVYLLSNNFIGGEKKLLKIGVILPLEDSFLKQGPAMKAAADLAMREINGQNGKVRVELLYRDGGCESNKAARGAEDLINKEEVNFVIGGFCESEIMSMAKAVKGREAIVIASAGGGVSGSGADNFFSLAVNNDKEGFMLAEYLATKAKVGTAAVVYEKKDYALTLVEDFKRYFSAKGGKIAADIYFYPKSFEASEIINELKGKDFGALVLISEMPAVAEKIALELKTAGLEKTIFLPGQMFSNDIWKDYSSLDGFYTVKAVSEENKKFEKFAEAFKKRYGEEVSFAAEQANIYSTIYLLAEAAGKYGDDFGKIKNYLVNLKKWEQALGSLSFDEAGNRLSSYAVYVIKDGKLESVKVFKP
ncbi:MAG: ABC transporter substrate-binding protein [Patescibacteria group bacterium]|nr:ABC transporter substrate-binding protein [Patescibacteria group bacterium]MDD5490810.1 ABC transporter substrate-binding protein [Patescibacteria group bacterium]